MEAFAEFSDCTPAFWSLVKFVSETLGYTQRGRTRADSRVKTYCHTELYSLFNSHGLNIDDDTVSCIISYRTAWLKMALSWLWTVFKYTGE